VQGEVDRSPGERETVGDRRAEHPVGPAVKQLDVERGELQQQRLQVPLDHHGDRLGGLVAPAGQRALLAPTHDAVLGGDLHEDHLPGALGTADRAAAEDEVLGERHGDGEDLDGSDAGHQAAVAQEAGSTKLGPRSPRSR
jgi:hypothetical protein